jgi:hypothetical protein
VNKIETSYEVNSTAALMMEEALRDKHWNIRLLALKHIGDQVKANKEKLKPVLLNIAANDDKPQVRAQALRTLNKYFKTDTTVKAVVEARLYEKSNVVKTSAFRIIADTDKSKAATIAQQLENSKSGSVLNAEAGFYKVQGDAQYNEFFISALDRTKGFDRYTMIDTYGRYLRNAPLAEMEKGVEKLVSMAAGVTGWGKNTMINTLEGLESELTTKINETTDKIDEAGFVRMRKKIKDKLEEIR